jgi:hypothetical protein
MSVVYVVNADTGFVRHVQPSLEIAGRESRHYGKSGQKGFRQHEAEYITSVVGQDGILRADGIGALGRVCSSTKGRLLTGRRIPSCPKGDLIP